MSRFRRVGLLICLFPLLLTGCWDIKDLQEVNYLTAIGFDIEGKDFVIYGQMLDFASVAKNTSSKMAPTEVWVGKGKGKTIIDAIDDLYRTTQLRVFYGHVNAIVLGEKLLNNKSAMEQVEQFQGRFYELRYTPWIFGAADAIGELFSATSVFDLSPGVSVLHQPMEAYRQRSVIRPISVRTFTMEMSEPSRTTLLPSIALSDKNWSKGNKAQNMLTISGAYVMKDDRLLGWFPVKEMLAMTWVEPNTYRGPLVLSTGEGVEAALSLSHPKYSIRPEVRDGKAEYAIRVELSGTIVLSMTPQTEAELGRQAVQRIQKQIRDLYNKGLKINADLLNLETALYRKKNQEWKQLQKSGGLELTPESLKEIDVSVKIERTGNMKSQVRLE